MYIHRSIETAVRRLLPQRKVVLVTGARQVGKTTMLRHTMPAEFSFVTLDDFRALQIAERDPMSFFSVYPLPTVVGEVQHAPSLFRQIKFVVDQSDAKGSIVLTGSQTYRLMHGVSESLAGRVGVLEMSGLSLRELSGSPKSEGYVPLAFADLGQSGKASEGFDLWRHIQRGQMPELQNPDVEWESFYADYVRSYIERDVRELINIKDELKFNDFLVACAARTGQLFNAADISSTVGIDSKTVQSWLSVLQASGLVHLIRPLWSNPNKRLSKTPKLFFMDTGLVCYLLGWTNPVAASRGAMSGHLFETFVADEILKSYMNAGRDLRNIWFYRDAQKREIDFVVQDGHVLHPIEVKQSFAPGPEAARHFSALEAFPDFEVGPGSIVCMTDRPYPVAEGVAAISPWDI